MEANLTQVRYMNSWVVEFANEDGKWEHHCSHSTFEHAAEDALFWAAEKGETTRVTCKRMPLRFNSPSFTGGAVSN